MSEVRESYRTNWNVEWQSCRVASVGNQISGVVHANLCGSPSVSSEPPDGLACNMRLINSDPVDDHGRPHSCDNSILLAQK